MRIEELEIEIDRLHLMRFVKLIEYPQRVRIVPPPEESILLRIFTGDNHRYHRRPLFEAIVLKARDLQLAGATVLHGVIGFGKSSRLHQADPLMLSSDLPVVIEIVDSSEKINAFLPILEEMMSTGLITTERARVVELLQLGKTAR